MRLRSTPVSGPSNHLTNLKQSSVYHRAIHTTVVRAADVVEVEGPAFAESISEGDIRWVKREFRNWNADFAVLEVGDSVKEDELVAEIETDKVILVA